MMSILYRIPLLCVFALALIFGPAGASPIIEIRTAAQESAPKFIVKPDGSAGGLCVDIMRAIEQVDPRIRFVGTNDFLPFKRLEGRLAAGNIDVFFGFSKTAEREAFYRFISTPLYRVDYRMAVRAKDSVNVRDFEAIRSLGSDAMILALFGTADVDYLRSQSLLEIDDQSRTVEAMLDRLIAGRARFAYYHELGLVHTIRERRLGEQVRVLPAPFKATSAHYAAFSPQASPEKIAAVERALTKLQQNGTLDTLLRRYQMQ